MWNELQIDISDESLSNEGIAGRFESMLKEKDANATVKFVSSKNLYEISYKGHMFEIQANGTLTSNREDALDDVKDAWEGIDQTLPDEDKAEQLEDELQKEDPNSSAEYNPDTGNIEIDHGD